MKSIVKMTRLFWVVILFFITAFIGILQGQVNKDPLVIGERVRISSKVLNENRLLFISLPSGYENSQKKYPVLYMLDGGDHYLHCSGIVNFLSYTDGMPEMIIVSILNLNRGRDFSPSRWEGYSSYTGGADNFIKFLKEELIPFIDENYRTHPYKVIAGHSLGGTFVSHTFLTQPDVFDAYISISPAFWWGNDLLLNNAEKLCKTREKLGKTLFVTYEYSSGSPFTALKKFETILEEGAPEGLNWKIIAMTNEDHFSMVYPSLYEGLGYVFSGWKLPGNN